MPLALSLQNGLLFVAMLLIVGGFLMRRAARRRLHATAEPVNVAGRADRVVRRIEEREARLYDYSRACDAQFETRTAALRTLIAEADNAAARLARLLAESQSRGDLVLPFDERSRAVRSLRQAGYSDEQVETLLARSETGDSPVRHAA